MSRRDLRIYPLTEMREKVRRKIVTIAIAIAKVLLSVSQRPQGSDSSNSVHDTNRRNEDALMSK
jgi:hypothetical protein